MAGGTRCFWQFWQRLSPNVLCLSDLKTFILLNDPQRFFRGSDTIFLNQRNQTRWQRHPDNTDKRLQGMRPHSASSNQTHRCVWWVVGPGLCRADWSWWSVGQVWYHMSPVQIWDDMCDVSESSEQLQVDPAQTAKPLGADQTQEVAVSSPRCLRRTQAAL